MNFTYDFKIKEDIVYFAYCLPYTYSKLQSHLKQLHCLANANQFLKEENFCYSLTGVSVPILTVTSHVVRCKELGAPVEIEKSDFNSEEMMPVHRFKKYILVCSRVHPGESNSSYIMQGFLDFITGNSSEAIDLRRKIVFKIIPMINPDGVIAGNYRTSLSGNDLNR